MIDLFRKVFMQEQGKARRPDDGGRGLDVRMATCALLLEMSYIDGEFNEVERERLLSVLKRHYGLSNDDALDLMATAKEELDGSVDLWQFASLINEHTSVEEKIHIIETIWEIAFTDGKLDQYEDYLIHRLAKLLRLTHRQLIDAKLRVKQGSEPTHPERGVSE